MLHYLSDCIDSKISGGETRTVTSMEKTVGGDDSKVISEEPRISVDIKA